MSSKSSGWFRILYIILSVLYIFCGISLLTMPSMYGASMIYVIGLLIVFYGAMMVGAYFMATNFKTIWTLLFGIVLIVLGIMCMCNIWEASLALAIVIGIGFIIAGGYKIYQSFVVKDLGVSNWWLILILGICNLVVGAILLFNLQSSMELITILVGCNLLVNGVSDLMLAFMAF